MVSDLTSNLPLSRSRQNEHDTIVSALLDIPNAGFYNLPVTPLYQIHDSQGIQDYVSGTVIDPDGVRRSTEKPVWQRNITGTSNISEVKDFYTINHWPVVWHSPRPKLMLDTGWLDGTVVFPLLDTHVAPFLNEYGVEAFSYFGTIFPNTLSLSEFVEGIFQWRELIPTIEKSLRKTVLGGYLNWEFGWRNLLQDLKTISGLAASLTARLDYLSRTSGRPQRLGFSRAINLNSYTGLANPYYYTFSGNFQNRVYLDNVKCTFRAGSWVLQDLPDLHSLSGYVRAMVGALGLDNPLESAWKIFPLSFVVDWFLNISKHLDQLTRINPAEHWAVYKQTWSLTFDCDVVCDQFDAAYMGEPEQVYPCGSFKYHFYRRGVGLPFRIGDLTISDLSTQERVLLAAMIGSHGGHK